MQLPGAHATRIRSLVVVPESDSSDSRSQQNGAVEGSDTALRVATAASDGVVRLWDMAACQAAADRWASPELCTVCMSLTRILPECRAQQTIEWEQVYLTVLLICSSGASEPLCEATTSARLTCLTYVDEKTPEVLRSLSHHALSMLPCVSESDRCRAWPSS